MDEGEKKTGFFGNLSSTFSMLQACVVPGDALLKQSCCAANVVTDWDAWQSKIQSLMRSSDSTPESKIFRYVSKLLFNERIGTEAIVQSIYKHHQKHPHVLPQLIPQICKFIF